MKIMAKSLRFLLLVFALFGGGMLSYADPAALRSIQEIRRLPPAPGKKLPVLVEGQVLWAQPFTGSIFMYHEGGCIYVNRIGGKSDPNRFSAGEMVRVKGRVSGKRDYAPSIVATTVRSLGQAALPVARPFLLSELYSTMNDCDWVQLSGRVVSMRVFRGESVGPNIVFQIQFHTELLSVQVPMTEDSVKKAEALMFHQVHFNAVVGTQANMNRQIVGRIFFVNRVDDLEVVVEDAVTGGSRRKPIEELALHLDDLRRPVTTCGLVTHAEAQHLYLRGEKACIQVTGMLPPDVGIGDSVEINGFALSGPISPSFLARDIRIVEHGPAPEPVPLHLNEELRRRWGFFPDSSLNQELVQIDARLIDVTESFGLATGLREQLLLCRQGKYVFRVKLPFLPSEKEGLVPGARLRITGICNLTRSQERSWRLYIDWFWVQPRSLADVEILAPAPWWTAGRLVCLLAVVLGVTGLFLAWITALRRTVDKQTGVIAEKIEHESIYEERQRIARELHDNLQQGLTGSAIRLESSCRLLDVHCSNLFAELRKMADAEAAGMTPVRADHLRERFELEFGRDREEFKVVQKMLSYCDSESRNSIMDLRGGLLEQMDLPEAVREALEPLVAECGAALTVEVTGPRRRLQQIAERNLLMVVREAASNAVRHGHPAVLRVELNYGKTSLALCIEDDGGGFDLAVQGQTRHFGLCGMRERINRLNGKIEFESHRGEGTRIRVLLPSLAGWEIDQV